MPGDGAEIPAVDLTGTAMLAIIQAIPELEARTGRQATVIGGLAVLCRLGTAYRATSDLDTANRRAFGELPQLEVLLQQADITQAGPAGVWMPTSAGKVQVDIVRLILDPAAGTSARAQLGRADAQLAQDARLHATMWFVDRKDQTLRLIRELPEGADVDADTIQLASELLFAELKRSATRTWPNAESTKSNPA